MILKTKFLLLILLLANLTACAKELDSKLHISLSNNEKVECIRSSYELLKLEKNKKKLQIYFECFPNNFDSFVKIFGYTEIKNSEVSYAPLYEQGFDMVFFLEETAKVVPKQEYYNKLINMSSDGYWQADAVNVLQHIIHKNVKKDFIDFEKVLSQNKKEIISGFWRFYFDSVNGLKIDKSICHGMLNNGKACMILLNKF